MSKQLALIFSYIEDPQTSLAELRALKKNVEQLQEDQSASDDYLQKLCQRITKLVDEEILVRSLLQDR